jgi:hypothetical protein
MTQQQVDELIEAINERSHELCHMIRAVQEVEGRNPSESWLFLFHEITKAWFTNDNDRLREISNFVIYGSRPIQYTRNVNDLIFGPGPLTDH